jgi:esterase/lipase
MGLAAEILEEIGGDSKKLIILVTSIHLIPEDDEEADTDFVD